MARGRVEPASPPPLEPPFPPLPPQIPPPPVPPNVLCVKQVMTSNMPPHQLIPSGSPMHVGEPFLGPLDARDAGKPCLVLDLDETLVHSSFKPVPNPDYIIPVEIDGSMTDVYVLKRPWVDFFMVGRGARTSGVARSFIIHIHSIIHSFGLFAPLESGMSN